MFYPTLTYCTSPSSVTNMLRNTSIGICITRLSLNVIVIAPNRVQKQKCSVKKVFFKILQNSQENTCVRVFFFSKSCRPQNCSIIKKETVAQVFTCEFCVIFRNTFFYRKPLVAVSASTICLIKDCHKSY